MSTTPDTAVVPTGTPPGWVNRMMATLLRTPGVQRILGKAVALITITGRRTGREITFPVSYARDGDDVLITTKAFRTWWRNLQDHPQITLRLAGRDHLARAQVAVGDPAALPDLIAFLTGRRQDARAYGIDLDARGRPDPEQVEALLPHLVVIRARLDATA